jgi:hypothetical protein
VVLWSVDTVGADCGTSKRISLWWGSTYVCNVVDAVIDRQYDDGVARNCDRVPQRLTLVYASGLARDVGPPVLEKVAG